MAWSSRATDGRRRRLRADRVGVCRWMQGPSLPFPAITTSICFRCAAAVAPADARGEARSLECVRGAARAPSSIPPAPGSAHRAGAHRPRGGSTPAPVRGGTFYRHNGSLSQAQLSISAISDAPQVEERASSSRSCTIVPLPQASGSAPRIGMRLDDARSLRPGLRRGRHHGRHAWSSRHVSERRQPAGSNFTILASPSLTLGCRAATSPSFWRVDLDAPCIPSACACQWRRWNWTTTRRGSARALASGALESRARVTIDVETTIDLAALRPSSSMI